jgi:hypothetical protein
MILKVLLASLTLAQNQNCSQTYATQDSALDEACGPLYRVGDFNESFLNAFCSKNCVDAVTALANTLKSSTCSNVTIGDMTGSGATMPVAALGIHLMVDLGVNCVKSNGTFCLLQPAFQNLNTSVSAPKTVVCNDCYGKISTQVQNVDFSAYPSAQGMFSFWMNGKATCSGGSIATASLSFVLLTMSLFL